MHDNDLDVEEKLYTTATVCSAAGVKAVTFRAWRARNGLFPETLGGKKWNRFSFLDICVVRAVVVLIEHGLGAEDAISLAHGRQRPIRLDERFREFFRGNVTCPVIGFSRGDPFEAPSLNSLGLWEFGNGSESIPALMNRTGGVLTLVDLRAVVDHVLNGLAGLNEGSVE
jgi:hypothetical protein